MGKQGHIIIIEDDPNSHQIYRQVFNEICCPNKVLCFLTGKEAHDHICDKEIEPFLFIVDIEPRQTNGFTFRKALTQSKKFDCTCIPYLIFADKYSDKDYKTASELQCHCLHERPKTYQALRNLMAKIIDYWSLSVYCEFKNGPAPKRLANYIQV